MLLSGQSHRASGELYLLLEIEEIGPVAGLPAEHIQLAAGVTHTFNEHGELASTSIIALRAPLPPGTPFLAGLPSIDYPGAAPPSLGTGPPL